MTSDEFNGLAMKYQRGASLHTSLRDISATMACLLSTTQKNPQVAVNGICSADGNIHVTMNIPIEELVTFLRSQQTRIETELAEL